MLKTVLITGARGALGQHVVRKFSDAGIRVIGAVAPGQPDRPADTDAIRWIEVDVTDSASVRGALAKLQAERIDVDGLIHCAGGFRYLTAEQNSDQELDFLFDVNLRSAFLLVRELLPAMKSRGFGRIVLVSAKASLNPGAGVSAYAASKAGLNALVASLAEETRDFDINVNAVLPTMIDTPANRRDMPKADFGKWVAPGALASIIFSLTQPWGQPIHGALIPVAGRL
jgi:NAD(P)-dependent dehydrogenase (short-subunit alcohol dehydrogenase family)